MATANEVYQMTAQKNLFISRHKEMLAGNLPPDAVIFSPLELYLDPEWQQIDPPNTIYVTAAASSGGYRAYQSLFGLPPTGHRQKTTIHMNTRLVSALVKQVELPPELKGKTIIVPHYIGTDIPSQYGTLLGKNEAHLMMQWLMRIVGVSEQIARNYCAEMERTHSDTIDRIGNPTIPKQEKISDYYSLIQVFLDSVRSDNVCINPFSAILLGLDWKNSLGSKLEAAVAYLYSIPVYELTLDQNHPDFLRFMRNYRLEPIKEHIHLPTIHENGLNLALARPMSHENLVLQLDNILEVVH